jgi:hypothetical protein
MGNAISIEKKFCEYSTLNPTPKEKLQSMHCFGCNYGSKNYIGCEYFKESGKISIN